MANVTENVNPEPQIEGEVPEPQISGTQAGQSLGQAGDSAVTLEAVEKLIQKEVQSIKDTRLGKHGTRLDNLEEAVAQYESLKGGSVDIEALGKMQGNQELADIKAKLEQVLSGDMSVVSAGAGAQSWTERQASILKDAGLEQSDSRLVELLREETFANHDEYIERLEAKSFEWKQSDAKKPKPSPSTVAQTIPGIAPSEGDFKGITDDELGAKAIELGKHYTKNQSEITRINNELERRAANKTE